MNRPAYRKSWVAAVVIALTVFSASEVFAFWNTYRDIFPGNRAAGMSGAYTAISDDASGVFYNPAGVAAVVGGDVSLSANAVRISSLTDHRAIFGKDLDADSIQFIPTSVSSIKQFGDIRVGLSIIVSDQNGLRGTHDFEGLLVQNTPVNFRFDLQRDSETYMGGPTIAYPITPTFSVGATVYYIYGYANQHDFILAESAPEGETPTVLETEVTSADQRRTGFIALVGFLWKPIEDLRVGFTFRSKSDVHNFVKVRDTTFTLGQSGDLVIGPNHGRVSAYGFTEDLPWSGVLGVAYKPWDRILISADVDYHMHASYPTFAGRVTRDAVVNYSVGAEAYVTEHTPLWVGFFTDNSNLPDRVPGKTNQIEKIDFTGFTVGGALEGEHATGAIGVRCGFGSGKGLKPDDNTLMDVNATDIAIFLASRYRF